MVVNILIADDNIYYAKNLMTYINETSKEIRVCNIAIDGNEVLNFLNETIDIVLLDLNMPNCSGIEVLKKLSVKQREKYNKSFIIISGEDFIFNDEIVNNDVVYKVLPKILSMQEICSEIEKLVEEKVKEKELNSLKLRIINELTNLGYEISHKGTIYLIDIIYTSYEKGIVENLTKEIYPVIAKKYNQSINNIKSNVIRATEAMYYNCEEKKFKEYFRFFDIKKPTIKIVVSTIVSRLRLKEIREKETV